MASFTGIRNENEFYFAHYLSSLMDDDLRAGSTEELAAAVDRLKACSDDWFRWRSLRERFLREAPDRDDRAEMAKFRNAAWRRLAAALGWTGDLQPRFSVPGATAEFSAIPALGLVRTAVGDSAVLLLESFRSDYDTSRRREPTLFGNRVHVGQLEAIGLPLDAQHAFTDLNRHSGADTPTWEWLLSHEIFSPEAPVRPRFVLVFCETGLVLLDRDKWTQHRFLVFDFDEIFESGDRSSFRAAALLLSRAGLCPDGAAPLPDRLEENSRRNAFGVSKELRVAMRDSVERLGNAILASSIAARRAAGEEAKANFTASALSRECVIVMYRFLFVLYLESRRDINVFPRPPSGSYAEDPFWSAYGFDHLRDLEMVPLLTEEARSGTYFDETIKQLFAKIWNGVSAPPGDRNLLASASGFALPPLKAHLFDPARTPLFDRARIPNEVWQRIVYNLSVGRTGSGARRRTGRISYARLGIQQLGAVYEALLSYTGFYAASDLFEVVPAADGGGAERAAAAEEGDEGGEEAGEEESPGDAAPATASLFETGYFVPRADIGLYGNSEILADPDGRRVVHEKGSFIYRMAGRDRERSASYYTPLELTHCLVRHALAERVAPDMKAADIMRLTVCEPAMGSAAFLNEVVDQLADLYLDRAQKESGKIIPLDRYAAQKARVKMVLADNNVYGVDLNPTAADLAEVSLWLGCLGGESLPTGQDRGGELYIPWFGTQLRCGNSIVGARREVVLPDGTRKALKFSDPLPDGAVWHFLLPDPAMGRHADKVVKGLLPDETKAMAAWSKAFNKAAEAARTECSPHRSRKGGASSPSEPSRLARLTRALEDLWQQAAKDAEQLEETTRDDVAYFGHESKQANFSDIPAKDGLQNAAAGAAEDLRNAPAARRLRLVLDAWCALWFWPLGKAADLPSWDEWLDAVELVATGLDPATGGDLFSFFAAQAAAPERQSAVEDFAKDPTPENLARLHPFTAVAHDVAAAQRFLHWELDFADVFRRRGGFDLVIGNPPWVKLGWEEAGVLSEYDPRIAVRKMAADKVAQFRADVFARKPAAQAAYISEYTATTGQKAFLSAESNYPDLKGVQTNLFKFFLPLAFRIAAPQGVAGFVHPEGVYDDPKGGALRARIYPRLRLHANFINWLKLFEEPGGAMSYGLNIYGPPSEVSFKTCSKLFHPNTLETSLFSNDRTAPLPLERDERGHWNLVGHPDRIVDVTEQTLSIFAALYDEQGTPSLQARLPSLYTRQFVEDILPAFRNAKKHISDYPYGSSACWDETNAKKIGIIQRETTFPHGVKETIFSAPQFYVATPLNKCPRPKCHSKGDYDSIDLSEIPETYASRTNYFRAINQVEYTSRLPTYKGRPFTEYFRVFARHMVNASNERTLISCFVPKGVAHINTIVGYTFDDSVSMPETTSMFGLWQTLPFDWFVRSTGKGHFLNDTAHLLPVPPADARVSARALLLNCLSKNYEELWGAGWQDAFLSDNWLSADPHLTPWADHLAGGKDWRWATPLRSALDRRQALVELDVLAARALGLSLEDLLLMYRVSFPTMRKYDTETFYDQKGRVVFTSLKGGGGLSNAAKRSERNCEVLQGGVRVAGPIALGWQDLAGLGYDRPGIEIRHTIVDQVLTDEPSPHTVSYVAPFFRKDREADYREVWETLDGQEGKDSPTP